MLRLPALADGSAQYCVHWQRELRSNFKTLFVLLTGTDNNGNQVAGMEPSTYWRQIQELTKTSTRPQGIKGSRKLLSKNCCPCLVHACISQCSCPHCTQFLENLDHRHLAVKCGWRKISRGQCDKCGGECNDPDGPWRAMSGGLLTFTKTLLCPAVEVPGVITHAIDPFTGFEIPGDTKPVKMIPRRCWLGKCAKCGWNNRFKNFPRLKLQLDEDAETTREVFVRACPLEARLDINTTFHMFQNMERGTASDGTSSYTQPEWTPITVSRRKFYYRLYEFMIDFMAHYYKVRWHECFDEVFREQYRRLAFVGMPDQPQPTPSMKGLFAYLFVSVINHCMFLPRVLTCNQSLIIYCVVTGTAILTKDFAAAIDHDKKFNKTCSYPERSHEWVRVYQCLPYLHKYSEEARKKRRGHNRRVRSVVRQKVIGIFALSKRKGDTTFDQTVQTDLVHVMKTGKVPSGSKSEWFWRGTRLLGSNTARPITAQLIEATTAQPLHPGLMRLIDKRDRCTGQFQGKDAFFSNQEFQSRTGTSVVDLSQTSCHGKSYADGASNTTTGHLRQAARENAPVAPGTRGLVLFLASKMGKPAHAKTDHWMSFDEYLVAYYPEDGFDESKYKSEKGYDGSSMDHFYTNDGLHRIAVRHLRCMCTNCINNDRLFSESCELSDWCGKVRHYNLRGAKTTPLTPNARPRREIMSCEEFAKTLGTHGSPCERVVACWVHDDDINPLDEPFYLARTVSKARRIDKDCLVGGNEYKCGHLVVNIKWYLYSGNSRGDRLYRLQPGCSKGVVYSVESLVRKVDGIRFKSYSNGTYVLDRETVNRLTRWLGK